MKYYTCGECDRDHKPIPIGIAEEINIPADQSIIAELGLLCPDDHSLIVTKNQRACTVVEKSLKRKKKEEEKRCPRSKRS